jgi:hypothetical protein
MGGGAIVHNEGSTVKFHRNYPKIAEKGHFYFILPDWKVSL